MTKPRIRAVLFDYGGVLTEGLGGLFQAIVEGSGADIPEIAAFLLGPYEGAGDHMWHRLERGEVSFQAVCDWAREEGTRRGWRLDLSPLPDLVAKLVIRDDVVDRVRRLRESGYRTAVVTNNAIEFSWKSRLPFDELFDVVVNSCETGFRKPDARIYTLALERLEVAPHESVFLDDFPVNVEGARRTGMHGILVGPDWQAALAELDELLTSSPLPLGM